MKTITQKVRDRVLRTLLPPPFETDHWEYSGVSLMETQDVPCKDLISLALQAAECATSIDISEISGRMPKRDRYCEIWPGQHYKLLAGLLAILRPHLVIEIGTYSGLSTLTLRQYLPPDGRLVTFDIIPWDRIPGTIFKQSDFDNEALKQTIADLSQSSIVKEHADLLRQADFIFVDAAKDGKMEWRLLNNFKAIGLKEGALLCFDEIRLWNMLAVWKSIPYPKMDVTSLGHYTGTGLVLIDR